MDSFSAEDSLLAKVGLGVAMALLCSLIFVSYLQNRSMARMSETLSQNFAVLDRVDGILLALDRLRVEQRAFLATDDEEFSEGIVESIMTLQLNINGLKALSAKGQLQPAPVAKLGHTVNRMFDLIGQSYELRTLVGTDAAVEFFDANPAMVDAQTEAQALRRGATAGFFARLAQERKARSALKVLF